MNYEHIFDQALDRLHSEGRYRVFIDILRGSVVMRPAPEDEGVTEIELVEHIDAAQGGVDKIRSYLVDLHAAVAARSQGRPLPDVK